MVPVTDCTIRQAKKLIKAALDERSIPYTRLSARTVGFMDLARATCVFVTIHGWRRRHPALVELKHIAIAHGFRVDIDERS